MPTATIATIGSSTTAVSTTTSATVNVPTGTIGGQYTFLTYARDLSDATDPTAPTNWAETYTGWVTQGAGASGRGVGGYHRSSTGNIVRGESGIDAAGTAITMTDASCLRGAVGVTFSNCKWRSSMKLWNGSVAAGANGTSSNGGGNATTWSGGVSAAVGEKVVIALAANGAVAPTFISSTQCASMSLIQSVDGGAGSIGLWVFAGDVTSTGTSPSFTFKNNGAAATVFCMQAVLLSPFNAAEGGATPRIMIVGDSLAAGSNFGGLSNGALLSQVKGGFTTDPAERWIDRLFGKQSSAYGATVNFASDNFVTSGVAPSTWWNGTYAPSSKPVRLRTATQPGWDTAFFIANGFATNSITNITDSGYTPDILVIALGANDEKGTSSPIPTPTYYKDALYAMACVYNNPTYVILVKEWAWSYDFGTASFAGTRPGTHAQYATALDDAATLIAATGRTVIVTSTAVNASMANQVGTSTPGVNRIYSGLLNDGVNVSTTYSVSPHAAASSTSDNIHSNALGYAEVWAPTLRYAFDQIPGFAAATASSRSLGRASIPTMPSISGSERD